METPMIPEPHPVGRVPVLILTGFLGSGKTTMLNRLLKLPALQGTAVVINEFGEVGLDHHLIERSDEDLVLLANGCICCTVRGDLIETFDKLTARRARDPAAIKRVIVETTGLADPAPILHTLMNDASVTAHYRLENVIATIDAVNAMDTFDRHPEAVKQAAVADGLLLTKTDLVEPEDLARLTARLALINPAATLVDTVRAPNDVAALLNERAYDPSGKPLDVQQWLRVEAYGDDGHAHSPIDRNRHDDRIRAYSIIRDKPVSWAGLSAWLDMLAAMRGNDLLRVKGIINVAEHPDRPVVIHGVQHLFHPHEFLPRWPSEDRRTRIVFITRDIDREAIDETLRIFENRRSSAGL
jgi:G3E family GTPase